MNAPLATTASGAVTVADRLADWSSMARGWGGVEQLI